MVAEKDKLVCDVHCDVRQDLRNLQEVRGQRLCGNHEARLQTLEESDLRQ